MQEEKADKNVEEAPSVQHTAPERILLQSIFPDIEKMTVAEMTEEVKMWRNIWGWIPSNIKYYVSRTGSQIGLQIRNYHRYLGVLLDTAWTLESVEVGVYEKLYDQNDGQYYFERKIVKIPVGQVVAFDWIKERINEKELTGETTSEAPEEQPIEIDARTLVAEGIEQSQNTQESSTVE